LSNQVVARTNRRGLALVTGLLPYQLNLLSLDPNELPLDTQIDGVLASAVPFARSGSYIEFPVSRSRNVLLVLLLADGSPVPAGARVSLGPGLQEFPVARRGEVYLTGIADVNHLSAHWSGGSCSATWRADATDPKVQSSASVTCGVSP
jgi:outer membrane usher protein